MVVFYCFTHFHILNAINLKIQKHNDENAILILYNPSLAGTVKKIDSLKALHLFDNVLCIKNSYAFEKTTKTTIKHIYSILYTAKRNKEVINNYFRDKYVNIIYSYGTSIEFYVTYTCLHRNNVNLKWVYYEDGIAAYTWPFHTRYSWKMLCLLRVFLSVKTPEIPCCYLVYAPDLIQKNITKSKVSYIPPIENDTKWYHYVSTVYKNELDGMEKIQSKFIFFDQAFDQKEINDFQRRIIQYFPQDSLTVKLHPRTQNIEMYDGYPIWNCGNIPWEVVIPIIGSQTILVSVCSTACITPKMIFNKELKIIFLHKMFDSSDNSEIPAELDHMIGQVSNMYKNPGLIHVPKNEKELTDVLQTINEEV